MRPSARLDWYSGPTLLEFLEAVEISAAAGQSLRMPVQWVNRPNQDFRGFSGTLTSGMAQVGDDIVVLPSGASSRIAKLLRGDDEVDQCVAGDAATLILSDEIDISRGDVISARSSEPGVWDQFVAKLVWMGDEPMLPGRPYLLKCATQTTSATVTSLKGKVSVETSGGRGG